MVPVEVTLSSGKGSPWWICLRHLERRPFSPACACFRDDLFVVKWDLDNNLPMMGKVTRRVRKLIERLESEGEL